MIPAEAGKDENKGESRRDNQQWGFFYWLFKPLRL